MGLGIGLCELLFANWTLARYCFVIGGGREDVPFDTFLGSLML